MAEAPEGEIPGRRPGGIKVVRPGVWRVDVELARDKLGPRRRVSRTVSGSLQDAEAALDALASRVASNTVKPATRAKSPTGRAARPRRSGAVTMLAPDRWLVGVEGAADPVTGKRRRHTSVVNGTREQAEIALARMKLLDADGLKQTATSARTIEAACNLYLADASTELQTQRTDRSACHRICGTVVPGGITFGDVRLNKVDWRMIEQIYAKWEETLQPPTRARYASTLSKVLDHSKRVGWIRLNPAADARRPKVPTHKPDVPKTIEVREALDRAKRHDFEMYAYVMGLATLGCRRSELLALYVEDVDLAEGVVTIRASLADGGPGVGIYRKATKRDDWRDVPLTAQMADVFRDLFSRRTEQLQTFGRRSMLTSAYVFSDDPDGATWLRPDTTTQRWLAARGTSKVTFAMLRRYVATQLLDVTDGDYRTVSSITGNSEETLRRWYDAGANMQKKKAVVELSRL
jgi:integrase